MWQNFQVGWNYVDFTHRLMRFQPPQDRIPADFRNVTLFRTKFVNNSKTPQFYTFRLVLERRSYFFCIFVWTLTKLFARDRPNRPIASDFAMVRWATNPNIQKLTFSSHRTERQTKSTCTINVQKGYTLGATLNLEFALPTAENAPVNPEVNSATWSMTFQENAFSIFMNIKDRALYIAMFSSTLAGWALQDFWRIEWTVVLE